MRLKEDSHSWRSSGIKRRDYRHDLSTPEVPRGHPKRKQKKPRVRIDHKHVWVEAPESYWPYWFEEKGMSPRPKYNTTYQCSHPGCKKHKYVANPRYGYEYYKWCKNNGLRYTAYGMGR